MSDQSPVIRTREMGADAGLSVRHPFNPNAEINILPLSRMTGLKSCHLNLGRLPPGKESFAAHAHTVQEEFIFILEGTGRLIIGGDEFDVEAGDYVAFPPNGAPHNLSNSGDTELVYLMGGGGSEVDVIQFPDAKKLMVMTGETIRFFDQDMAETYTMDEWFARVTGQNDGDK